MTLTIQYVHQHGEIMRRINGARIISRVGFIYFRNKQRWVGTLFHYLGFDAAIFSHSTAQHRNAPNIAALSTEHQTDNMEWATRRWKWETERDW